MDGADQTASESPAPPPAQPLRRRVPAWDRHRVKAMFWGTGLFVILYIILIVTEEAGTAWLFNLLPLLSAYVVGRTVRYPEHAISTAFLSFMFNCIASYLFLGEGILCVVMASPILAAFTWVGAILGREGAFSSESPRLFPVLIIGGLALFSAYDAAVLAHGAPIRTVTTEIRVAATPEQVWAQVSFDREPSVPISGWLGKLLPLPDHYRFSETGTDAQRVLDYGKIRWHDDGDTPRGVVQFRVSEWEPNQKATFTCNGNTTRINKWICLIDTTIELERVDEHTTAVKLTTHYRRRLGPAFYFNSVLDYGVERMHAVLLGEVRHGLAQLAE